jgi:hypothetical protein
VLADKHSRQCLIEMPPWNLREAICNVRDLELRGRGLHELSVRLIEQVR